LVGAAGFEPTMAVSKTAALPLGYAPLILGNFVINFKILITKNKAKNKAFDKLFRFIKFKGYSFKNFQIASQLKIFLNNENF